MPQILESDFARASEEPPRPAGLGHTRGRVGSRGHGQRAAGSGQQAAASDGRGQPVAAAWERMVRKLAR